VYYIAFLQFHFFHSPRNPKADIHLTNIDVPLERQDALRGRRELLVEKPPSNGKHSDNS
jgi:predicted GTPase